MTEDHVRGAVAVAEDFLTIRGKRFAFDHYSLAQWLTEEDDRGFPRAGRFAVNLAEAQERLTGWALQQARAGRAHESVYLARHLPAHLGPNDRAEAFRLREVGINVFLQVCSHLPQEPGVVAVYQAMQ